MSNTVLFGKVKDAEVIVYNFRGQMQCRMGGKREGPIETYPKFWNLNPLTADGREILRIPAWKESFALVKRELEAIMEKEILPAAMPEFPIVRRMTLGMNGPLVVPSIMARMTTEEMQKYFTDGWDPLFIGYTAAVYFHTSEAKINSWTTQAKKMRGSQPPGYEVRKVLRALEQEGLENMLPIWDDGRMIMMEGHVALVDDMKFATRRYRAPYGLEQVEMRQEGKELDAAGQLHVALTEYKRLDRRHHHHCQWIHLETRGVDPWRTGSKELSREEGMSQKKRVWMKLSVKPVRTWKWGIRLNQDHQGRSSPLKSC